MRLTNLLNFLIVLNISCLPFASSKRFIFNNDKYYLSQYDYSYDQFNNIESDIYFFYDEKVEELLEDENVIMNEKELKKYISCRSNKNRDYLELLKIDLMMKNNESITDIKSNNSNCYFFFNYNLIKFQKYSGSPRLLFFPIKPSSAYSEYSNPIASYVGYTEIKNFRLVMYLDKKNQKNIDITILTNKGKTYKYFLKNEHMFNFE